MTGVPLQEVNYNYSRGKDGTYTQDPVIAIHNIRASGLDKALKEGAIPAPSVGLTKRNSPFEAFGEISLIGDKQMIDPANPNNLIYSGDVYTPRVPRPEYTPKSIYGTPLAKELTDRGIYYGDFDSLEPSQAIDRLTMETRGATPYSPKEAKKIIEDIFGSPHLTMKRSSYGEDLSALIEENPFLARIAKESASPQDFNLTISNDRKIYDQVSELAKKKFDGDIYAAFDKLESDLFHQKPVNVENQVELARQIIGRNLDGVRGTEQGWDLWRIQESSGIVTGKQIGRAHV